MTNVRFSRRNLVAQMRAMRHQQVEDEKKLLDDLRELSRLLENDKTSKHFLLTKSHRREKQSQLNELFAGKGRTTSMYSRSLERVRDSFHPSSFGRNKTCIYSRRISSVISRVFRSRFSEGKTFDSNRRKISQRTRTIIYTFFICC